MIVANQQPVRGTYVPGAIGTLQLRCAREGTNGGSPAVLPAREDHFEPGTSSTVTTTYTRPTTARPAKPLPDDRAVVRGGTGALPPPGTTFSGAAGVDKRDAGRGVPHGMIRSTTAGEIRKKGGQVEYVPELSKGGMLNERHVDIVEGISGAFGELEPNPAPKHERIQ